MSKQYVFDRLVKAQDLMERAREQVEDIDPVTFRVDGDGRESRNVLRNVTEIQRSINRALTSTRAVCFELADDVTLNVDIREDETDNSGWEIDP